MFDLPEHLSVEKQHEKNSFRSNSQKRTREAVCAFLPSQNLSVQWWIWETPLPLADQNFLDFMYVLEILEISCIATAGGLAYRQRMLDWSLNFENISSEVSFIHDIYDLLGGKQLQSFLSLRKT